MKRLLHHLQSRPPQVRLLVAAICALVATGVIAAGWVMVPSSGQKKNRTSQTVTPINALVDSVEGVFKNSPLGKKDSDSKVEIIDVNKPEQPYQLHDETKPYQP